MPADSATTGVDGADRAEAVAANAYALFRVGGVIQVLIAMLQAWPHLRFVGAGLLLAGAVCAQSMVLAVVTARGGRVPALRLVAMDAALICAEMVASAVVAGPASGHTWVFFMYPFALLAVVGFGLSGQNPPVVAALAGSVAAAYVWSAIAVLGDPAWNVVPNAVPYLVNAFAAWAVARTLRRNGAELDQATMLTARREAELARQREQARHARLLHDRVLQTMETLAVGPWLRDANIRGLVAQDAAWLRSLVQDRPEPGAGIDLVAGLDALAGRHALAGLSVHLHTEQVRAGLRLGHLPAPEVVEVVIAAVGELLTNVAKHAGVADAVVRGELSDSTLVLSVVDAGRGFDPAAPTSGLGLHRSVHGPVESIGGAVTTSSVPGGGTHVELKVPLRGPGPPAVR